MKIIYKIKNNLRFRRDDEVQRVRVSDSEQHNPYVIRVHIHDPADNVRVLYSLLCNTSYYEYINV